MADATSSAAPPVPTLEVSTAVTATDHGKIVTVPLLLCLVVSLLLIGVRIQIRWPWRTLFGKDDYLAVAATVVTIVQSAVVLNAIDNGFGQKQNTLDFEQIRSVEKEMYATDLLYVLSLFLSRLSICFLFLRFASAPNRVKACWIFTGAVVVYGIVGIFIIAIRQSPTTPWSPGPDAVDSLFSRWMALGVLGAIIDVAASIFPVYLIWGVQMDRSSKRVIVIAFALRLPTILLTGLRLDALSGLDGTDFCFDYVMPEVFTQIEMHYALVSATIPCLRIFLKAWNSHFIDLRLEEMDHKAYHEHETSHNASYNMTSFNKNSKMSKGSLGGSRSGGGRAPWSNIKDYGESEAHVNGGRRDTDTASENSQKAIVVRQTIDVDVDDAR